MSYSYHFDKTELKITVLRKTLESLYGSNLETFVRTWNHACFKVNDLVGIQLNNMVIHMVVSI